jgi:hypothetical protein
MLLLRDIVDDLAPGRIFTAETQKHKNRDQPIMIDYAKIETLL